MPPKVTCECEDCNKCKHRIYMRDWYRRNAVRHRETARRSRLRRLDRVQAYDRGRGYRCSDKTKEKARNAARKIPLAPCEICGTTESVQKHHDDYTRPTDVRFLCKKHHAEEHHAITQT